MKWLSAIACWLEYHDFQDIDYRIESSICVRQCESCRKTEELPLDLLKKNLVDIVIKLRGQVSNFKNQVSQLESAQKDFLKSRTTLWHEGRPLSGEEYREMLDSRVIAHFQADYSLSAERKEALCAKVREPKKFCGY